MIVTATRSGPSRARFSQNFLLYKIDNVIANALLVLRVVALGLLVVERIPVDRFACKSQGDSKSSVRRCASMNNAILVAIAFNLSERIERRCTFSEFFGHIRRRVQNFSQLILARLIRLLGKIDSYIWCMHGVRRFARFESRAFAQLADKNAIATAFFFAEIFSRFFYLHAAVWRRRFLTHEHEHSVVVVFEIEREIFR